MAVEGVESELVSTDVIPVTEKIQGISLISVSFESIRAGIAVHFRSDSVEFPVCVNREFIRTNREIWETRIGLSAAIIDN
jgi:hypothetical protein